MAPPGATTATASTTPGGPANGVPPDFQATGTGIDGINSGAGSSSKPSGPPPPNPAVHYTLAAVAIPYILFKIFGYFKIKLGGGKNTNNALNETTKGPGAISRLVQQRESSGSSVGSKTISGKGEVRYFKNGKSISRVKLNGKSQEIVSGDASLVTPEPTPDEKSAPVVRKPLSFPFQLSSSKSRPEKPKRSQVIFPATSTDEFYEILAKHDVSVAYFGKPTCPPCVRIKPSFERYASGITSPKIAFIYVDTDAAGQVSSQQQITSTPTFKFFARGQQVHEFKGASEADLRNGVEKYTGPILNQEKDEANKDLNVMKECVPADYFQFAFYNASLNNQGDRCMDRLDAYNKTLPDDKKISEEDLGAIEEIITMLRDVRSYHVSTVTNQQWAMLKNFLRALPTDDACAPIVHLLWLCSMHHSFFPTVTGPQKEILNFLVHFAKQTNACGLFAGRALVNLFRGDSVALAEHEQLNKLFTDMIQKSSKVDERFAEMGVRWFVNVTSTLARMGSPSMKWDEVSQRLEFIMTHAGRYPMCNPGVIRLLQTLVGIKCSLDGFVKAVALARQWKMTVSKRWANASGEDKKLYAYQLTAIEECCKSLDQKSKIKPTSEPMPNPWPTY